MAPTLTASTTPTNNSLASLRSVSEILHLSYHRNKNQHRLAKWWSSLSQLKRNVQKLITELEALETAEKFEVPKKTKGKKGTEGKYVAAARGKVEVRVQFMESWLVPGCYAAFANLIADNQYAPLGLVLMGTLARTKRVIRPFGKEIENSSLSSPPASSIANPEQELPSAERPVDAYDLGEVVSRSHLDLEIGEPVSRGGTGKAKTKDVGDGEQESEDGNGDEDVEETTQKQIKKVKKKRREATEEESVVKETTPTPTSTTKRRSKKRKNGGDAFDDLFSSLI